MNLRRRIESRLADSPFARGVMQLTGATLAGHAIVLLAVPLLTRLYSPQEFGVATVFASLSAILYPLSSLRYEIAIPLPKEDEAAWNLLALSLLLLFPTTIGVALLIWFVGPEITRLTHSTAIDAYLWLAPIGFFGVGAFQAVLLWSVRLGEYRAVARSRIVQGIGLVLTQAGGGLAFGPSVPWLLGGQLVGQIGGLGSVSRDAWHRSSYLLASISPTELRRMAHRYRRFPQLSLWSGLLNSLALLIPGVLLAASYGIGAAGTYSLAARVMGLPMALVGQSVSAVYLGEASRAWHRPGVGLKDMHSRAANRLFLYGALPTLAAGAAAPLVAGWVFGSSWSQAGHFMLLLAPSYAAGLVAGPLSYTFEIAERLMLGALWDVGRLVLVVASILVPFMLGFGVNSAIGSLSAVMVLAYIGLLVLTRRVSRATERNSIAVEEGL